MSKSRNFHSYHPQSVLPLNVITLIRYFNCCVVHPVRRSLLVCGKFRFKISGGLFFIFTLLALKLFAGTSGIIEGNVVDEKSGTPLIGVNVILKGTKLGSATDDNGQFKIYNVPAGSYDISFSMIGYTALIIEHFTVLPQLRSQLKVKLSERAIAMDEIVIRAEKPLIRTDVVGSTHEMNSVEITQLPLDNFQDVMEIQPGVTAGGAIKSRTLTNFSSANLILTDSHWWHIGILLNACYFSP